MFVDKWDHENTGQTGGTVDADMDTPEAWAATASTLQPPVLVLDALLGTGVQGEARGLLKEKGDPRGRTRRSK